jgi:two-component system phosphate regulon sensor histidine kinase PhoR
MGSQLIIEDTGIGIAEENLERIFDRFFTVDKSHNGQGGGFGLGLAVVKKICKRAGWEIRVESKLGEGTRFTINF